MSRSILRNPVWEIPEGGRGSANRQQLSPLSRDGDICILVEETKSTSSLSEDHILEVSREKVTDWGVNHACLQLQLFAQ